MRAHEFITERKKRKRRPWYAAYGPGPYGGYGYYAGYSGDSSGSEGGDSGGGESINYEASYPGNIGMMELAKFFQIANPKQKELFKQFLEKGKKGLAWKLIQDITDTKLQGKEFEENFADGKKPGRKGLAKRSGVNTKASVSSLRKTAKNSSGEKARMAHWLANMKAGRAKKEDIDEAGFLSFLKGEPAPKKKWDPSQSRVVPTKKDDEAWIKLLIDKHRRGISLTNREWDSLKQWQLQRAIKDEDLTDEGWKDWVAGAAIGAASLGAAGDADASVKKDLNKPAIQQVIKKQDAKPVAPPEASEKELAKSVTGNAHEVYLKKAAEKAGIQGNELVAFLSQCAHETMDFKHMKEIGGSLDFRKYDPKYAPKKAKALGNKQVGDGAKYKGRGYIQLTRRDNYKRAGQALGLPLEQQPELVEKPEIAAKVAVWYWNSRVASKVDNFKNTADVTKTINPGMKHLDQRKEKQQSFQVAMR